MPPKQFLKPNKRIQSVNNIRPTRNNKNSPFPIQPSSSGAEPSTSHSVVPSELEKFEKFKNDYQKISREGKKVISNVLNNKKDVISEVIKELKRYGFKIHGGTTSYNKFLKTLKSQLPNSMKNENVKTISGIINLFKIHGNSNSKHIVSELPKTRRQINFNEKIREMKLRATTTSPKPVSRLANARETDKNRKKLFELLLEEFPDISENFVNSYNDTNVSNRLRLYNYTQRKLKTFYKTYLNLLNNLNTREMLKNPKIGYTQYAMARNMLPNLNEADNEATKMLIQKSNNYMNGEKILRKFFLKITDFSQPILKKKKFYGETPLYSTLVRVRTALQNKKIRNKRPLTHRALNKPTTKGRQTSHMTHDYESNAENNNSSIQNIAIQKYNTNEYKKMTIPSDIKMRADKETTANIDINTFITLNILLWMDQKHDKICLEDNFFLLLINNKSTIYTIFPKYIKCKKELIQRTMSILKYENKRNYILDQLLKLNILTYKINTNLNIPELKINSQMEKNIKNNFSKFLPQTNTNKNRIHDNLDVISKKKVINKLIKYISIDSESDKKIAFRTIPFEKRYIPLERVLDPGYGFSENSSIVNFLKRLTPRKKLQVIDFQMRKYKIIVCRNPITIGYVNNVNNSVLKVNNVSINIGNSKAVAQKDLTTGKSKSVWSKTFGDFMQVLAIASRDRTKKPVHYGTFDTMSALLYLFVRRYVYKMDKINLALEKKS